MSPESLLSGHSGRVDCIFVDLALSTLKHNLSACHSQGLVECRNGQCVPSAFQCDGDEDCKDGSDEENCSNSQTPCQEGDQRCLHSSCLDSCGGSSLCERNNSLNNCSKCHS
nr:atrial natriuretic peptide-converting enzyme-like isoform X2 [Microcebus murinus]